MVPSIWLLSHDAIVLLTAFFVYLRSVDISTADYTRYSKIAAITMKFRCPADCDQVGCQKMKLLKRVCKGGTVYDSCGCCQSCAKRYLEKCGGHRDCYGKCGPGLYCYPETARKNEIGVCKHIPRQPEPRNSNMVEMCQPRCTPEFCSKWPDAVCSAVDNVIIERSCQQPCQHTVCQACYFKTKREPPCRKCARDDFNCMKGFARCLKKDTCTRHKFPCEPHQRKRSDGRFVCKVPACLWGAQLFTKCLVVCNVPNVKDDCWSWMKACHCRFKKCLSVWR